MNESSPQFLLLPRLETVTLHCLATHSHFHHLTVHGGFFLPSFLHDYYLSFWFCFLLNLPKEPLPLFYFIFFLTHIHSPHFSRVIFQKQKLFSLRSFTMPFSHQDENQALLGCAVFFTILFLLFFLAISSIAQPSQFIFFSHWNHTCSFISYSPFSYSSWVSHIRCLLCQDCLTSAIWGSMSPKFFYTILLIQFV